MRRNGMADRGKADDGENAEHVHGVGSGGGSGTGEGGGQSSSALRFYKSFVSERGGKVSNGVASGLTSTSTVSFFFNFFSFSFSP